MTYLCYRFGREELLGVGTRQKVYMQYPGKGAGTYGGLRQFPPPYPKLTLLTGRYCCRAGRIGANVDYRGLLQEDPSLVGIHEAIG